MQATACFSLHCTEQSVAWKSGFVLIKSFLHESFVGSNNRSAAVTQQCFLHCVDEAKADGRGSCRVEAKNRVSHSV